VGTLLTTGCGDQGGESPETVDCDRQPPLNWSNFGEGFFSLHCTSCHSSENSDVQRSGAPIGLDFDTYSEVVREVSRIEIAAIGDDAAMPPSSKPTEAEIAMLSEWLTCAVWPDHDALEANGGL
jgi:hypothetical protein